MEFPASELPTIAQKHAAAIEHAALKLAAGATPRQAARCLPQSGLTADERADLMAEAVGRARELIQRNLRRNRRLGAIWCICGCLPWLVYTIGWLRDGRSSWILLLIGIPALIQGLRTLARKPTDLDSKF
ncbi:hypothetical protein [Luteolibacter marinus]|uniref:hypothetical protein n=1 Tax=Luteolibacter marinus TaxID=2776705 RepID=UPI0018684312|nr:hypothetical protein [Luteolibacter marinus]